MFGVIVMQKNATNIAISDDARQISFFIRYPYDADTVARHFSNCFTERKSFEGKSGPHGIRDDD